MSADEQLHSAAYFDANMSSAESHPIANGTAAVFTAHRPDTEKPNEDSAAVIPVEPGYGVLAVADGLGGSASGQIASRTAIEHLQKALEPVRAGEDVLIRTCVINGFEQANQAVQEIGSGAATTLAAVEINQHEVRPYHVGDSAILVIGGRSKIKFQAIAHSPTGYAVEAGFLEESEAMNHEERHVVSNFVGWADMRIDIGPTIKLSPRDTVILASDGLLDNVHLEEIIKIARTGAPATAVQTLATLATNRMKNPTKDTPTKPDDLTIALYRMDRKILPD